MSIRALPSILIAALLASSVRADAITARLPDGRYVTPEGFTVPVGGFASASALSPDGIFLAVLSQDAGTVEIIAAAGERSAVVARLDLPSATGLTWTADGLYVTRGYTGTISRFSYHSAPPSKEDPTPDLVRRDDLQVDTAGLLSGIAEDPTTHRIAVARTADREVISLDDITGKVLMRRKTDGEPFAVAFVGDAIVASLYNSEHIAIWHGDATEAARVTTGPHPTQVLAAGDIVYVANADGHEVSAVDIGTNRVRRSYSLAIDAAQAPGQTPSGMALSSDGGRLYVCESGFNDVAVVDLGSGRVVTRIPTGWYPMSVAALARATVAKKDLRVKEQLWVTSAKGFGSQPDPGGEWNGTYTGFVAHLIIDPYRFAAWSAQVRTNGGLATRPVPARSKLPPIKHIVFIVHENKHFDEIYGDEPIASADPTLLVYGRRNTPNAHALAERYALFDNFMSNGEASIYGHAWAVQGMSNDYHERNAHAEDRGESGIDARVPFSIWPYPVAGEDTVTQSDLDFDWFKDLSDLPHGPRMNVSAIFGPRGELIDALARSNVSFRVYGEQMTMTPSGTIAGTLAAHADRDYPGAHIDYSIADTTRAKLFLSDVARHGLAAYSYLTLPTDHTAGKKAGFLTPASYVADNDLALGQIVAGLSRRPDWKNTLLFVTCDDAQGTGDHVDSHRMPAIAIGPYVRPHFVDQTRFSIPSILRTVEIFDGISPLNIYDAAATPMIDMFATKPDTALYQSVAETVPIVRNPGKATSFVETIDGPDDAEIVAQEWEMMRGPRLAAALHIALQ